MPATQLDLLQEYVETAEVMAALAHTMGGGGHPGSFVGVLEGGVGVLFKVGDVNPEAPVMIRREVAAWRLARLLGWPDLVSLTVLRDVVPPGRGDATLASAQVLWPTNKAGVPDTDFSEDDRWRAAIFDALVKASDRHGGNWLSVPPDPAGSPRCLKLVDHGHAFDLARQGPSTFYLALRGQAIPSEYHGVLDTLAGEPDAVTDLLEDPEAQAFLNRLNMLRTTSHLEINWP